jgi:beta-glucosidase
MKTSNALVGLIAFSLTLFSCGEKFTSEQKNGFTEVSNSGGSMLGYNRASGVSLLTVDRFAFKDLNKNGKLDVYEDWRLSSEDRAKDLAKQMTKEQIAGLMLYSAHQALPAIGRRGSNYNGKPYQESGAVASDLSDNQKKFLTDDNLRHVLITSVESPEVAATWNNNAQAFVEGIGLGIPVNTSSDPRHKSVANTEYNEGANGNISMWPDALGMAATFDPALMQTFGEIASKEYRALGITTALSPQIDLATEPRWSRFSGTMGEDPDLATDLARAYVDGFQSKNGGDWGFESVNAMVKHWPGGGPEEGGRDGHFGYGAYAVYPGKNIKDHLQTFTEGAFKLQGATKMASAVMPYYTISTGEGEAVANGYNKYLIQEVLRGTYGYDGVLCTDWGVTKNVSSIANFEGKPWGVEELTEAERHYKAIEAGMDQFGGNNDMKPIIEAFEIGIAEHGEKYMRKRFERSAVRLLKNILRVGLFENPYLDIEKTKEIVGSPQYMKAGFNAQLASVVMLKNQENTLPKKGKQKVYIPQRFISSTTSWFGNTIPERVESPFDLDVVANYFEIVESPEEADFGLVAIESPIGGVGYDPADLKNGGNGYVPISLQYKPYKAIEARENSLAGGSPLENFTNRTYKNKTVKTVNVTDMNLVNDTKKKIGKKPVVVVIHVSKPMVFSEIESNASAILIHMGVQDQVLMEIISGQAEPSALLPFQMPADMTTVEKQFEDVPRDMVPHTDSEGNAYDFAFGLNWTGVIKDERVEKYK